MSDETATPGRVFVDRNVYELACERVSTVFDRYDHVAVSFSGGKDSTVVLQLALAEAERRDRVVDVVTFDEEAIHPPTVEYIRRVSKMPRVSMRWMCWPIKHRNACSRKQPWWFPWAPEDAHKWTRELPAEANVEYPDSWRTDPGTRRPMPEIQHLLYPKSLGTVGVMLGIRTQESIRRYRALTLRALDNWISPFADGKHIALCKPIYDWKTEDVWTAPHRFGWDYNRTYDVYAAAGIKPHAQRVTPPFGEEPLQGLHQWAVCFPETWERMVGRVEGVATAGRYARSPLYANGTMLSAPPEGFTWQDLIRHELMKWPEKERKQIAARITDEIATHNRRTAGAPIPDVDPEGTASRATMVSWQFLYMIAVRGDLKKRRTFWKDDRAQKKETPSAEGQEENEA